VINKNNKRKGFTLIEMLVAIALFAILLVVMLGAIITIVDSNRKARSLMTVMNNLNFAVDSMTRSFKTGDIAENLSSNGVSENANEACFKTTEIDYGDPGTTGAASARTRGVKYCWDKNSGELTKSVNNGTASPITSPDIFIEGAKFKIIGKEQGNQPLLVIDLKGKVSISGRIESSFSIHTSVTQRKLNVK
jgi:prepilin-type N-terminal cleavage/methylation domain-containing protein